jgi:hypothetical protein
LRGHADGPLVMPVMAVGKGDQKTRVRDAFHDREKPFREDRSRGPLMDPASRMNGRTEPPALARSSCSRMIRPCDTPVCAAVSSSQAASSLVRRIVIVWPIRHNGITPIAIRQARSDSKTRLVHSASVTATKNPRRGARFV